LIRNFVTFASEVEAYGRPETVGQAFDELEQMDAVASASDGPSVDVVGSTKELMNRSATTVPQDRARRMVLVIG
jgi:hypothetical protein